MKLHASNPQWIANAARLPDLASPYGRKVDLVPAAAIIPEPINWLWFGWLAAGKLHIIAGAPGTGKTTWAAAKAAIISNGTIGGRTWPDGTYAPVGNVIVWTGEDGIEDVIVPRLIAAGANMDRVFIIRGTQEHGRSRAFDFQTDLPGLIDEIVKIGSVTLIIIDSIVQAVSGNSHKNAEVRRSLEPLVNLAEQHNCAILGVAHLNKGSKGKEPIDRLNGSVAFGAVARLVMCTAKIQAASSPEAPASYVLVRVKSNLGPDDSGIEYEIEPAEFQVGAATIQTSRIGSDYVALKGSGKDLLHWAETGNMPIDTSAVAQAAAFLQDILSNGEVPYPEIERLALEAGISKASLKRAKAFLGIKSRKQSGKGTHPSMWRLQENTSPYGFPSQGGVMPLRSTFAQFEQGNMPSWSGTAQATWPTPTAAAPVIGNQQNQSMASRWAALHPTTNAAYVEPVASVEPVGNESSSPDDRTQCLQIDQASPTILSLVEAHYGIRFPSDPVESVEPPTDAIVAYHETMMAQCISACAERYRSTHPDEDEEIEDVLDRVIEGVLNDSDICGPERNTYRSRLQQTTWWM